MLNSSTQFSCSIFIFFSLQICILRSVYAYPHNSVVHVHGNGDGASIPLDRRADVVAV